MQSVLSLGSVWMVLLLVATSLGAQAPQPGPRPGPGPAPGPDRGGARPGTPTVSTADWQTISVAHSPASPATPSERHEDPRFYAPFPFSVTLEHRYIATLTTASGLVARQRYLVSTDGNFLTIGASGEAVGTRTLVTYRDTLTKVFEAVPEGEGFRLDSELHSLYSLDATRDGALVFHNAWGVARSSDDPGYLFLRFDGGRLQAVGRMAYNTTTLAHAPDPKFTARGWFVRYDGRFTLVAAAGQATSFALQHSPLDVTMPSDFNPDAVPYQPNPRVSVREWVRNDRSEFESAQGKFLKDLDPRYRAQVAEEGASDDTRAAAVAALDDIEASLGAEGARLRYPKALYLAFRDGALATVLAADGIANGTLGMPTVPFAYFTNATDARGRHHPFLVVASYSLADKPNRLVDVSRPPGDGDHGGYAEQSVTRDATLQLYLTKIPLRDYGLVARLQDNVLPRSLASDARFAGLDGYTYASTAAVGLAVDGVVIYPVLNNTLATAHEAAEITSTGIHVGRGMGLHYHADGHTAAPHDLTLYNLTDYAGQDHPPLIGFGLDGVALFGAYEAEFPLMDGYSQPLDEFGGHSDPVLGYHYHAHLVAAKTAQGRPYTLHVLLKGAWKGAIGEVPEFWDQAKGEPAYALSQRNAYVGWRGRQ